jgi:hypothetical protein
MTESSNLILIAYSSVAAHHIDRDGLVELLTRARKFNDSHGLTGMLLYVDESFFQILEGDSDELHTLYERIEQDNRHAKLIKLIEMPIEKRTFESWSMGYAKVTREELAKIPGLNDFFGKGSSFTELEAGKAKVLLDAFREGKWRRRLDRDA